MQLILTPPLNVRILGRKKPLELLPVVMKNGFPSRCITSGGDHHIWLKFIKHHGGLRLSLDDTHADGKAIQKFMKENGTEALSEDGHTAFTLIGTALTECDPSTCGG